MTEPDPSPTSPPMDPTFVQARMDRSAALNSVNGADTLAPDDGDDGGDGT